MHTIIHRANERGHANHGWLDSHHSFSFANYYDPEKMGVGKLRVLNDDVVAPSGGFGTHPHENMEIISIPLAGALQHKDSMGNLQTIRAGEVQAMSAGTGIRHSEYNYSDTDAVNFLQIWVLPKKRDITPRYDQKQFAAADRHNRWQLLVAPMAADKKYDDAVAINQDAYLSMARIDAGNTLDYTNNRNTNVQYVFVIDGELTVAGIDLSRRDALAITQSERFDLYAKTDSEVLVIEVPA